MVRGRQRLLISLKGDPNNVQIPVFVKHQPTQLKDPVRTITGFRYAFYCCIRDEQLLVTDYSRGSVVSVDRRASGGTQLKTVPERLNGPVGIATDQHSCNNTSHAHMTRKTQIYTSTVCDTVTMKCRLVGEPKESTLFRNPSAKRDF